MIGAIIDIKKEKERERERDKNFQLKYALKIKRLMRSFIRANQI